MRKGPSEINFRDVIEKAKEIKTVKSFLRWYDWERYSARQDKRMKMGGFVGKITFEGNIEPFMPLIRAGEILACPEEDKFRVREYEVKGDKDGV